MFESVMDIVIYVTMAVVIVLCAIGVPVLGRMNRELDAKVKEQWKAARMMGPLESVDAQGVQCEPLTEENPTVQVHAVQDFPPTRWRH